MSNMFLRHLTKDAQNNCDIKYKNQLKVKILNGQFAGETNDD